MSSRILSLLLSVLSVSALLSVSVLLTTQTTIHAFSPTSNKAQRSWTSCSTFSTFNGQRMITVKPSPTRTRTSGSGMAMFLGSDGGILGIGAPEVATIILVGYFILGPQDLYKLTKEIGKFIQNFRALGVEATKTLETSMESQLQLDEIRKAQRELNDAFSFRRTINVDSDGDAFSTIPSQPRPGMEPIIDTTNTMTDTTTTTTTTDTAEGQKKRKKIKRRKVVTPPPEEEQTMTDMETSMMNGQFNMEYPDAQYGMEYPDLDMSDVMSTEEALLRQQRMDRLDAAANDSDLQLQQNRFSQQLSIDDWNANIMANQEKLEPLALLMDRLAILEEEKLAADSRLEEEFRLRAELEEKYYKNKRQIIEEAAAKVQEQAYANLDDTTDNKN